MQIIVSAAVLKLGSFNPERIYNNVIIKIQAAGLLLSQELFEAAASEKRKRTDPGSSLRLTA